MVFSSLTIFFSPENIKKTIGIEQLGSGRELGGYSAGWQVTTCDGFLFEFEKKNYGDHIAV